MKDTLSCQATRLRTVSPLGLFGREWLRAPHRVGAIGP